MTFVGGNPWANRPYVERFCIFCGHSFMSKIRKALYCSANCSSKTWRSHVVLAGTHGYVDGKFQRLSPSDSGR